MKPRLLDLFCCAGGAARGYHDAGFEVVGVDIVPQTNYPFAFIRGDALEIGGAVAHLYDAIHASPPCQSFTSYRRKGHGVGDGYPDLIAETRLLLEETGMPYVIENVPGAPLKDPVTLCGSMFGLDVRRHRIFETNWPLSQPNCQHGEQVRKGKRFPGATNRDGRYTVEVGVWRIPLPVQQAAMQIDWMTVPEMSQAVPPAYTEFLGRQLLAALAVEEAV